MSVVLDTESEDLGVQLRSESLMIYQVGKVDQDGAETGRGQELFVSPGTDFSFPSIEITYGFLKTLLREIRDNERLRREIETEGAIYCGEIPVKAVAEVD